MHSSRRPTTEVPHLRRPRFDTGVMLTGFEPYQLFGGSYGWTDDRYSDWLARTLVDVLAGQGSD